MDKQRIIEFAQRLRDAPDNDQRMQQLVGLAPDAALARLGLRRRSGTLGAVMMYGSALVIGALVGAGAAMLLAPTDGKELRTKLRRQARRVSRDVKKVTGEVEEAIAEARGQVGALTKPRRPTANGKRPQSAQA